MAGAARALGWDAARVLIPSGIIGITGQFVNAGSRDPFAGRGAIAVQPVEMLARALGGLAGVSHAVEPGASVHADPGLAFSDNVERTEAL